MANKLPGMGDILLAIFQIHRVYLAISDKGHQSSPSDFGTTPVRQALHKLAQFDTRSMAYGRSIPG